MYFRIKDHAALRSWKGLRGAVYLKDQPYARGVTEEELEVLLLCDGEHNIREGRITDILIEKNLIEPCRRGEHPSDWSAYRHCDNRYFPKMNFMMTGKCNYLHCFNAADCLTNCSKSFRRGRVGWNPSRSEECLHELSHGDELQEYGF